MYRKCYAGTRAGQTVCRIEKVETWKRFKILQLGYEGVFGRVSGYKNAKTVEVGRFPAFSENN